MSKVYSDKYIGTDFHAENYLAREDSKRGDVVDGSVESRSEIQDTQRIASISQDFLPGPAGKGDARVMEVDQVSRGFAYALGFGLMFWVILALIIIFVKSL